MAPKTPLGVMASSGQVQPSSRAQARMSSSLLMPGGYRDLRKAVAFFSRIYEIAPPTMPAVGWAHMEMEWLG